MNDDKNLVTAITEVLKNQSRAEDHAQEILNVIERNAHHRSTLSLSIGKFILIVSILCLVSAALGAYKVYSYGPKFMALVPASKGTLSYIELLDQAQNKNRQFIWFDRKRIHPNTDFAKVDEQFPAQYEIWEGDKLIERWHWRVSHDPRTDQFGKYILRCVATYDDKENYTGFTQYIMADHPKDDISFNSTSPKSIVVQINTQNGELIVHNHNVRVTWLGSAFKNAEKLTNGYPHSKGSVSAVDLVENKADLDYIIHLSNFFTILKTDVVDVVKVNSDKLATF